MKHALWTEFINYVHHDDHHDDHNNDLFKFSVHENVAQNTNYPTKDLILQNDCNLVVYDIYNVSKWSSNTWKVGSKKCHLVLENDGNLILYSDTNTHSTSLWSSNTSTHTIASDTKYFRISSSYQSSNIVEAVNPNYWQNQQYGPEIMSLSTCSCLDISLKCAASGTTSYANTTLDLYGASSSFIRPLPPGYQVDEVTLSTGSSGYVYTEVVDYSSFVFDLFVTAVITSTITMLYSIYKCYHLCKAECKAESEPKSKVVNLSAEAIGETL